MGRFLSRGPCFYKEIDQAQEGTRPPPAPHPLSHLVTDGGSSNKAPAFLPWEGLGAGEGDDRG